MAKLMKKMFKKKETDHECELDRFIEALVRFPKEKEPQHTDIMLFDEGETARKVAMERKRLLKAKGIAQDKYRMGIKPSSLATVVDEEAEVKLLDEDTLIKYYLDDINSGVIVFV